MRDHLVLEGIPRRISVGIMLTVIGCAPIQETSSTPHTAIEQLLLGQAIERALEDLSVPIPDEQSLALEVTGLQTDRTHLRMNEDKRGILDNPSWDLDFVRDVVAARLGEMGYRIHKQEQGAPYLVRVMVQARGTNQGITFFGMPPVQSVIIPFALPALTLYELRNQQGYARISLDIFDAASGRFIRSTPWKIGTTFYNQYTYLFFFFTRTTDLTPAP